MVTFENPNIQGFCTLYHSLIPYHDVSQSKVDSIIYIYPLIVQYCRTFLIEYAINPPCVLVSFLHSTPFEDNLCSMIFNGVQ